MNQLYVYSHGAEDEHFSKWLLRDYEYAIEKNPTKFTALQAHIKKEKWHPQDILSGVFSYHCTIGDNLSNQLQIGDVVYTSRFNGKDRIGADLCEIIDMYSEIAFIYLFKEFSSKTTVNFKACHVDDIHEVQSKLIDFLS